MIEIIVCSFFVQLLYHLLFFCKKLTVIVPRGFFQDPLSNNLCKGSSKFHIEKQIICDLTIKIIAIMMAELIQTVKSTNKSKN